MRCLRHRAESKAASMWSVERAVGIFEDAWRIFGPGLRWLMRHPRPGVTSDMAAGLRRENAELKGRTQS